MTAEDISELIIRVGQDARKILDDIPGHTCPDINKVIKAISSAEKNAAYIQKHDDIETAHSVAGDIEYELSGLGSDLEDLRQDNSQLREAVENLFRLIQELEDA